MVVQSAMEEVRVCQVAPPPQLPVAPPPSATADSQQDDGEQSDPEVMQVRGGPAPFCCTFPGSCEISCVGGMILV